MGDVKAKQAWGLCWEVGGFWQQVRENPCVAEGRDVNNFGASRLGGMPLPLERSRAWG